MVLAVFAFSASVFLGVSRLGFFSFAVRVFVLLFAGIGVSKPAYISGLIPRAKAPPPNVFGLNVPTKAMLASGLMDASIPNVQ